MSQSFKTQLQHFIPQHLLSRFVGMVAASTIPWVKRPFINWFIKRYQVDLSEAAIYRPEEFANFNAFFTRHLNAEARPIDTDTNAIVSPADGAISQLGPIHHDVILQAKHHNYTLTELLGGNRKDSDAFIDGQFATVYLSPKDYHRVHMPLAGTLTKMVHIPGKLFSVNTRTADELPGLFARNERVVCLFDTEHGPMAVILVGAMIVASIETSWAGTVAPRSKTVSTTHYKQQDPIHLKKGEEMGLFKLGSTAIVLLPKGASVWNEGLVAGSPVKMGERMGNLEIAEAAEGR